MNITSLPSLPELVWMSVFTVTIPCILLHIWIIACCLFPRRNIEKRYLEANLSLGSVLHQIVVGYFTAALYWEWLWIKDYCGVRMFAKAIPIAMVTFTLVKITTEKVYVIRNLVYPPSKSAFKTVVILNSVATLVSIPIIFTRYFDPTSEKHSKCVVGYLFYSLVADWIYRAVMFLILCMIPSIILLKEIHGMVNLMQTLTMDENDEQKEKFHVQLELNFNWHRLRLMKSACVFTTLFVCYSLPVGIMETLDSPAVELPEIIRFYQVIIRDLIYVVGYLVVTVCPIVMHHAGKNVYQ